MSHMPPTRESLTSEAEVQRASHLAALATAQIGVNSMRASEEWSDQSVEDIQEAVDKAIGKLTDEERAELQKIIEDNTPHQAVEG